LDKIDFTDFIDCSVHLLRLDTTKIVNFSKKTACEVIFLISFNTVLQIDSHNIKLSFIKTHKLLRCC